MIVGAYEAKTHLSALLDRVERGERISISRHGRVVAVLTPPSGAPDRTVNEAIDAILAMPKVRLPDGMTIRDLIDEGRR